MSTIDLTDLQQPDSEGTPVTMPDGSTIVLKPLMALGAEHDDLLLEVVEVLGKFTEAADGKDQVSIDLGVLREVMPVVNRLLGAAAPTVKDGKRITGLPLMARFRVLMGYVQDQDLGGLVPSAN